MTTPNQQSWWEHGIVFLLIFVAGMACSIFATAVEVRTIKQPGAPPNFSFRDDGKEFTARFMNGEWKITSETIAQLK